MVSNTMYDPVLKRDFNDNVTDSEWWWHEGVEPMWYTNEKQGGISGVTWWPGYNIQNYTPTYWHPGLYSSISYKERVDLALSWLTSEKPPNLLLLYFEDLDYAGHDYGFGSPETLEEVRKIDNITGYLIEQLKKNNLLDKWNIILTSDHEMTNVSSSRVINITDYVNTSECSGYGGIHFVWPKKGMKDIIYKRLKENHHPHIQVYLKEDLPEKYHYHNNRRVSPIVLTVDEGWVLVNNPEIFKFKNQGEHGYFNTLSSMWPIFFARGPAFKQGYYSESFDSIDLYPLMCKLLKIEANPTNGSYSAVEPLLMSSSNSSLSTAILVSAITLFLILSFSIFICLRKRKMKKF